MLSSEWCSAIPSPGKSARALFLVRNGAQIFLDVGGKKGMPDNRVGTIPPGTRYSELVY